MSQSTSIKNLAGALVRVQAVLSPVSRNAENPFFKSSYADLAACIKHAAPLLTQNDLAVCQTCLPSDNGKITIQTTLMHGSGEWIDGAMAVTPTKNDPQAAGSAVTYMRRYGYCAIIGLAQEGEDDDGNDATHPKTRSEPSQSRQDEAQPTLPKQTPKPAPTQPQTQRGGVWRNVIVPRFIKKYAGMTLGEMADKDLLWWAQNYTPKPFQGEITQADTDFRAALDAGMADLQANQEPPPVTDDSDNVPF